MLSNLRKSLNEKTQRLASLLKQQQRTHRRLQKTETKNESLHKQVAHLQEQIQTLKQENISLKEENAQLTTKNNDLCKEFTTIETKYHQLLKLQNESDFDTDEESLGTEDSERSSDSVPATEDLDAIEIDDDFIS